MTAHAKFSASGSSRWLHCPGSLTLDNPDAPIETNLAAEIGTVCHTIAEDILVLQIEPQSYLGKVIDKITITQDMIDIAEQYVDYFWSYFKPGYRIFFEKRVGYEKYVPDGFGTLDACIIDEENKIVHIIDLKSGRLHVEVTDNSQLKLYALGIMDGMSLDESYKYTLHIVQPVLNNFSTWDCSYYELLEFGKFAKKQAKLALLPTPPRVAGEKQCSYCPNNPSCTTLNKAIEDLLDEVEVEKLSKEKLEKIFLSQKMISKFLDNVSAKIRSELMSGETYPNLKLIESKKNRVYTVDAEPLLADKLGDKAYQTPKLISLTTAQKLIKDKDFIDKITTRPAGVPIVVEMTDKRETWNPTDNLDFGDEEEL